MTERNHGWMVIIDQVSPLRHGRTICPSTDFGVQREC